MKSILLLLAAVASGRNDVDVAFERSITRERPPLEIPGDAINEMPGAAQSCSPQFSCGWRYPHDAANRLTEDSQNTYAYDALGRLLRKQDKQTGARAVYTWNGLGQLISVEQFPNATSSVATERILFTYDPLGRRLSKSVNGVLESYVYDGQNRIATLDASGQLRERVTFGTGIDEPLLLDGPQGRRFLHADALGSIVAATNGTSLLGRFKYAPFGEVLGALPSVESPFQFTAREKDRADLYYYRARYYDPSLGRFLSEDPIGFAGGDTHLYRYVANAPTQLRDPSGHVAPLLFIWAGVEVGLALYDAYDTYYTLTSRCSTLTEKFFAGGLFLLGAVLPGGGYSAADDLIDVGKVAAKGRKPPNLTPLAARRNGAFKEAKRRNGIPVSRQPDRVTPNLDRKGSGQPGRIYEFDQGPGRDPIRIRDDARGHTYGPNDPQNRGRHFNDPDGNHYDY
ncbi:MAG: RHS repeat-associated core domain-containing protein [Myxococcaceae bacterium]